MESIGKIHLMWFSMLFSVLLRENNKYRESVRPETKQHITLFSQKIFPFGILTERPKNHRTGIVLWWSYYCNSANSSEMNSICLAGSGWPNSFEHQTTWPLTLERLIYYTVSPPDNMHCGLGTVWSFFKLFAHYWHLYPLTHYIRQLSYRKLKALLFLHPSLFPPSLFSQIGN